MKLKELLDDIFQDGPMPTINGFEDYHLTNRFLALIEGKLLECDEFKNVNSLTIIGEPTFIENGETRVVYTAKLQDDYVFSGDVKILSIGLTPEIYDPSRIHEPVKDGCCLTPTMYDHENFTPFKNLVMRLNIEELIDNEKGRDDLHKLLDNILDNPKEYQAKGDRGIMVRGYWGNINK